MKYSLRFWNKGMSPAGFFFFQKYRMSYKFISVPITLANEIYIVFDVRDEHSYYLFSKFQSYEYIRGNKNETRRVFSPKMNILGDYIDIRIISAVFIPLEMLLALGKTCRTYVRLQILLFKIGNFDPKWFRFWFQGNALSTRSKIVGKYENTNAIYVGWQLRSCNYGAAATGIKARLRLWCTIISRNCIMHFVIFNAMIHPLTCRVHRRHDFIHHWRVYHLIRKQKELIP